MGNQGNKGLKVNSIKCSAQRGCLMIWGGTFFMIGTDWQRTFKITKKKLFYRFGHFILIFLQCLIAPETLLGIYTLGKQKKDTGAP